MSTYQPPVDRLLTLGETELGVEWHDYRALGIGPEHVPELIRLATDADLILQADEEGADEAQAWACEHALRAIGQLGAVEAVGPILEGLDRLIDLHDFWVEDLAEVMAVLGPGALPECERYLEDREHDANHRMVLCETLTKIAQEHPELRDRVVAFVARLLEEQPDNDPSLNGFLVSTLMDLGAVEAAPTIEAAFEAGRVDPAIAGDWPQVRYELGLGPKPVRQQYGSGPRPRGSGPAAQGRPDFKKLKEQKKRQKQARKASKKRTR